MSPSTSSACRAASDREETQPMRRRTLIRASLAAATAAALPAVASAQAAWKPPRPVVVVVPFAAGGTTDVMARLVAGPMARALGQAVLVENTTGAGGTIAAARVARAAPDGHTLLFAHVGVLAVNPHLYNRLQYDPQKDFRGIGLAGTNQMVLLVSERSGITTLDGFRERARRGELTAGTAGTGTTTHLGALQALAAAGGRGEVVPYRGEAPALNDLIAGTVDVMVSQSTAAIPLVRAGQARGLAVTGAKRLPELPDLATDAEAGLPGLDLEVWNALVLPRDASDAVVASHNAALATIFDDPQVQARFAQFSTITPAPAERTPEYLTA